MARTMEDVKFLSIQFDCEIHEQLEQFCDESGMTKAIAFEEEWFKGLGEEQHYKSNDNLEQIVEILGGKKNEY